MAASPREPAGKVSLCKFLEGAGQFEHCKKQGIGSLRRVGLGRGMKESPANGLVVMRGFTKGGTARWAVMMINSLAVLINVKSIGVAVADQCKFQGAGTIADVGAAEAGRLGKQQHGH